MKIKVIAVLTASALIIGGIAIIKNRKTESPEPQSKPVVISQVKEKAHEEVRQKSTSKPFSEIFKTTAQIEKRFKSYKIWVPGINPQFIQESSDGQYLAKYVNGKIILLDWLNPKGIPKYIGVTLRWLFFYDKEGRIDKVLLQTVPKFDNGKKHTKIIYTVTQRDSGGNPVAIDGIVFAPDWTVAFTLEPRYNDKGLLAGHTLYNKPETVRFEHKFEYDSNGICTKIGHNLTSGEWYEYVPVDWHYWQSAIGIVEFFMEMNWNKTYKNRVLGFN